MGEKLLAETLRGTAIASIGPFISDTLRRLGLTVTVEARESTMAGLVGALQAYFSERVVGGKW